MSVHFLAAIAGTLIAAAGTAVLAARCARAASTALVAWTVAIVGLTVALAAQALGYRIGFGPVTFRAMEIGAQVLAPLALALGLAELAGQSITARFAARLVLTAVGIVSLVVLATDPLSAAVFSRSWPAATDYYQIVPNKLLEYVLAPVTVIVALIAMGVSAARAPRDPAWRDAWPAAAAAGVAALMLSLPGISALAGASLPLASAFTLVCAVAAAAAWFAGVRVSRLRPEALRPDAGVDAGGWPPQGAWPGGRGARPDLAGVAADDEFGTYRNGSHRQRDEFDYEDLYAPGAGYRNEISHPEAAGYPGEPGYRDEMGYPAAAGYPGGPGYRDELPPLPSPGREPAPPLFGQIAIYTLLEERVDDFDRMTRQMVKQVRAHEPDTLVYIVHAVPSAPMQRILYEVYRDRGAYEEHRRQPYVAEFQVGCRPYVLATNVIELGLQQAKISPLPTVSDLLSDSGFDLLADTGSGQPGYGPRPGSGPHGSRAHGSGTRGSAAPGGESLG